MKKNKLHLMRLKILDCAKKHIIVNGWNENIFSLIAKDNVFKENEIRALFIDGYKSLLNFYLDNIDIEMTKSSKKLNLLRMKTHERVKEIILLRLKLNHKDKKILKRTLFSLMLPQNANIGILSLYKTVDQIWYLSGDNSTDFNFYTKRITLAGVYSATIFYWLKKNKSIDQAQKFLEKQLKNISKIPKMKEKIKSRFDIGKRLFLSLKKFSNIKQ